MRALAIGGTRNLGPSIVSALLDEGFQVAIFHRGQTQADLPDSVERFYGDRGDPGQLRQALAGSDFDLVVDTTLYNGPDARAVAEILEGRVGRYVMLSTGQVYLVREALPRPYREQDYAGPTIPLPSEAEYKDWTYGIDKRAAEDVLMEAHGRSGFPFTALRLPMVNSERDHFHRIAGYLARMRDGGPILVPEGPALTLKHVYGDDVVQAIVRLARSDMHVGDALNISQDEEIALEPFLEMLASMAGYEVRLTYAPRERLEVAGLLPQCSAFSDPWMSALDNQRSKAELGMVYTPLAEYLQRLVRHYAGQPDPPSYAKRPQELLAAGTA